MEPHEVRRTALRGLVLPVLTVAVVVGGFAGGRAGGGEVALVVAALVTGLVAVVLGALVLGALAAATVDVVSRPGDRPDIHVDSRGRPHSALPTDDLAARWAVVEPFWSGRH